MHNPALPYLLCLLAFFCGAIPFGFIAGKRKGIDIREHGSKNIGATNTLRVLGKKAGITVLILDAVKGLLPVLAAAHLLHLPDAWQVGVGLSAILGHIYSPFVRFKGGKGVATALGVIIGFNPLIAAIAFAVFFAVTWATKYVSLGSILGAIAQAILFWVLVFPSHGYVFPIFGTVVALFVVARHRANIGRLLSGTENKWGATKKAGEDSPEPSPASPDGAN